MNTSDDFISYFSYPTKHFWRICFSFKNNVSLFIEFKYMKINYPTFSILPNRVRCGGICFCNFRKAFFFYYFNKLFTITFFHK